MKANNTSMAKSVENVCFDIKVDLKTDYIVDKDDVNATPK